MIASIGGPPDISATIASAVIPAAAFAATDTVFIIRIALALCVGAPIMANLVMLLASRTAGEAAQSALGAGSAERASARAGM